MIRRTEQSNHCESNICEWGHRTTVFILYLKISNIEMKASSKRHRINTANECIHISTGGTGIGVHGYSVNRRANLI